jgi:hypothetical protein
MVDFLIVDKKRLQNHDGEEYDNYLEVDTIVEANDMCVVANKIRNSIREIFVEEQNAERKVNVCIDASPVYSVIAVGLYESMLSQEGIELVLPESLEIKDRTDEIEGEK